jgi:hypothetical protein
MLLLESKLKHSSRVPSLAEKEIFKKMAIKQTPSARDFLRRGFLNSSLAGQVSPKVFGVSPSSLDAKEEEVVSAPPLLGRCVSAIVDKGEDLSVVKSPFNPKALDVPITCVNNVM